MCTRGSCIFRDRTTVTRSAFTECRTFWKCVAQTERAGEVLMSCRLACTYSCQALCVQYTHTRTHAHIQIYSLVTQTSICMHTDTAHQHIYTQFVCTKSCTHCHADILSHLTSCLGMDLPVYVYIHTYTCILIPKRACRYLL
jgi:hypothetical protein